MAYWPGEDYLKEEEGEEQYEERKRKRSAKVAAYISSPDFEPGLVRTIATCQTRWAFDRLINPKSGDDSTKIKGIRRALTAFLDGYRSALNCTDIFANFLIERLRRPSFRRVGVFATMCRSAIYLAERNRPFCSNVLGALRGETSCSEMTKASTLTLAV